MTGPAVSFVSLVLGRGIARGPVEERENTHPLETLTALRGLLACEIAEAVVFCFGFAALVVVEGCGCYQ